MKLSVPFLLVFCIPSILFAQNPDIRNYNLKDTIAVDLNGDGQLEKAYFSNPDCRILNIISPGLGHMKVGCEDTRFLEYPELVDWVDHWGVFHDKETWEVYFKENGDIAGERVVRLENPGIYIGKSEVGGGIITIARDKLVWIHQAD